MDKTLTEEKLVLLTKQTQKFYLYFTQNELI